MLIDDSIVRGTTTGKLVRMMFDAGAAEVHVRITAPPVKNPCYYGIDMANQDELVAARSATRATWSARASVSPSNAAAPRPTAL